MRAYFCEQSEPSMRDSYSKLSILHQILQRSSRFLEEEPADKFDPYRTYQYRTMPPPWISSNRPVCERARSLPGIAQNGPELKVTHRRGRCGSRKTALALSVVQPPTSGALLCFNSRITVVRCSTVGCQLLASSGGGVLSLCGLS